MNGRHIVMTTGNNSSDPAIAAANRRAGERFGFSRPEDVWGFAPSFSLEDLQEAQRATTRLRVQGVEVVVGDPPENLEILTFGPESIAQHYSEDADPVGLGNPDWVCVGWAPGGSSGDSLRQARIVLTNAKERYVDYGDFDMGYFQYL